MTPIGEDDDDDDDEVHTFSYASNFTNLCCINPRDAEDDNKTFPNKEIEQLTLLSLYTLTRE